MERAAPYRSGGIAERNFRRVGRQYLGRRAGIVAEAGARLWREVGGRVANLSVAAARSGAYLAALAFVPLAHAGQLDGSIAVWNSSVTISTEGNLDWASWGPASGTTPEFNSKSGGSPEISVATAIASTESASAGDTQPLRSWTGGTPNATRTDTRALHYFGSDNNDGFSFTVPCDTTPRRLKTYLSVFQATANVTVSLSDASASNYTTNWAGTDPAVDRVVTTDYACNSGGQTLTFQVLLSSSSSGVIGLLTATLSTPTFTAAPVVASQTASAYTISYTALAAGDTIWCGAYAKDASTPTAAQIKAGTGARGVATEATTGASDSIVLTPTDNPPFPIYDLYCVLERGTSVFGVVADGDLLDELLDVPAGEQRDTVTTPLAGFLVGSSAAAGDIMQSDSATSPGAYALTVNTDGSWEYAAGGDESKQTWEVAVYDVSAVGWIDSPAYRLVCVNNAAPRAQTGVSEPVELSYLEDIAIATVTLTDYGQDDDADALDATNAGGYATGLSESANALTGTPTTPGITRNVVSLTDECGDAFAFDLATLIRPERPLHIGVPTNYTFSVGAAITPVDFCDDFDHDDSMIDPCVDLTYALLQLGSAVVTTAANGAFTSRYAITVDDASGFAAGDYAISESDSTPRLIVGVYGNELEFATPFTAADNDDVSLIAATAASIDGLTLSMGGALSGIPTGEAASNLIVRATDADSEIKDSSLFSISVVAASVGSGINIGLRIGL